MSVPYTGEVTVGGPSALRVLDRVEIRKACVGPMENNAYLLTCRQTGHQLLVDAAADSDRLVGLVREGSRSTRLDVVVTTHGHRDHHGALEDLVSVTGALTTAGVDDVAQIPVPTRRPLRGGDTIVVGAVTLAVIALRGHTHGSVALVHTEPEDARAGGAVPGRSHVFTGDSLFPGGVGSTQGDPARFAQLLADVTERIFDRFRDDTWIYPGHGADTTLGAERPHLGEWLERGW